MDPVMYIASSRLECFKQDRGDAFEDFYQTHGHLPIRIRFRSVAAFYRRLRALVRAQSAKLRGLSYRRPIWLNKACHRQPM